MPPILPADAGRTRTGFAPRGSEALDVQASVELPVHHAGAVVAGVDHHSATHVHTDVTRSDDQISGARLGAGNGVRAGRLGARGMRQSQARVRVRLPGETGAVVAIRTVSAAHIAAAHLGTGEGDDRTHSSVYGHRMGAAGARPPAGAGARA